MYQISLDHKIYIENHFFFLSNQFFLCMQHVKSSIKTILNKIFERNVGYAKVDEFSTPSFKNDDVSRKIMTSSKTFSVKWQINIRAIHMQSFIAKPSLDQKLQRRVRICPPLVFRRPKKPSRKRVNPAFEVQIVGIRTMVPALLSFLPFLEGQLQLVCADIKCK